MDDLISRSQMSEAIKDYLKDLIDKGIHEVDITEFNVDVQNIIEEQPKAYDVDKVVEELQKEVMIEDSLSKNSTGEFKKMHTYGRNCLNVAIKKIKECGINE